MPEPKSGALSPPVGGWPHPIDDLPTYYMILWQIFQAIAYSMQLMVLYTQGTGH
jgi:hypothetical protein